MLCSAYSVRGATRKKPRKGPRISGAVFMPEMREKRGHLPALRSVLRSGKRRQERGLLFRCEDANERGQHFEILADCEQCPGFCPNRCGG